MESVQVLILSSLTEPGTRSVMEHLSRASIDFHFIGYEDAVTEHSWSVTFEPDPCLTLADLSCPEDAGTRVLTPTAVWMRRWGHPNYPPTFDKTSNALAFSEISSLVAALPAILDRARWINPPGNERAACSKVLQLKIAKSVQLRVPKTLITSDPHKIRAFAGSTGRVIFKTLSEFQPTVYTRCNSGDLSGRKSEDPSTHVPSSTVRQFLFTQELTPEKHELLDAVRWAPVMFQERIEKKYDIRITIVGEDFFACRIDSQSRSDTQTDFRVMGLTGMLPHTLFDLPPVLKDKLRKMMVLLGLRFGCVDMLEDRNGDFYFLEINPSGQWFWIEQVTGAPISESLAYELTSAPPAEDVRYVHRH